MNDLNKVNSNLKKGLVALSVVAAALSMVSATLSLYLTIKENK